MYFSDMWIEIPKSKTNNREAYIINNDNKIALVIEAYIKQEEFKQKVWACYFSEGPFIGWIQKQCYAFSNKHAAKNWCEKKINIKLKPLSEDERKKRRPMPPENLVNAQQDKVHKDIGKGRAAKTPRRKSR